MSNLDHILLYVFLYSSCIVADILTRNSKKSNNWIRFIYLPLIVSYIVTEGLRYGRGVDYFGYGPTYLRGVSTEQPIFDLINKLIRSIDISTDLPYGICFIAYATIFILCLLFLYKGYKYSTKYFLLFACLATLYMTEWTIRQGVSMSLFLPAIYFLSREKFVFSFCFAALAVFTHYGNIISVVLLYMCFFVANKKPFPIIISIPLFLLFQSFFELALPYIEAKISLLDISFLKGNFQSYINNATSNFGENAIKEEWERGTYQQVITTSFYIGLMIIGYYYHKINKLNVYIYNAFIIGILVVEPFHQMGNITRVFLLLSILWFIPLSLAVFKWSILKKEWINRIAMGVIVLYLLLYYGRYVFLNPTATYVWNITH